MSDKLLILALKGAIAYLRRQRQSLQSPQGARWARLTAAIGSLEFAVMRLGVKDD